MRVTAIHLSENTFIPDPICLPPLGHLLPKGPGDPRCRLLDQASCPLSLPPAETATAHLRPEAIVGHCKTVQYIGGFASKRWQFYSVSPFSCFKVIRAPRLYVSGCPISLLAWRSHHRWPTGRAVICSPSVRKLIMVSCSKDNRWPTTEQFGNSNNGHMQYTVYLSLLSLSLSLHPSVHAAARAACVSRHRTAEHALSPSDPPYGSISLFRPVCLAAVRHVPVSHDCGPVASTKGCVCSSLHGLKTTPLNEGPDEGETHQTPDAPSDLLRG